MGCSLATQNLKKAYELRDRVKEREKFFISGMYYFSVTGELEKSKEQYELCIQEFPRDFLCRDNLAVTYAVLGEYNKAAAAEREALRLEPNALEYANLSSDYLALNSLDAAKSTIDEGLARSPDYPFVRSTMYELAFLHGDAASMQQQLAWAMGKPGVEDDFLSNESDTDLYYGRMQKARELSQRAVSSAKRNDNRESAALEGLALAGSEVDLGNTAQGRQNALAALALTSTRDVQVQAALTLAKTGDATQAQEIVDKLNRDFPLSTMIQGCWLPTIKAEIELNRGNAARAIEHLQAIGAYELAARLYPAYIRGQAYLSAHQGNEAADEFQKIIDHRGIVLNAPMGALAHLQLGKAYALSGDKTKAKSAYQGFFALWKDADPDIPILKEAKAEYEKLK